MTDKIEIKTVNGLTDVWITHNDVRVKLERVTLVKYEHEVDTVPEVIIKLRTIDTEVTATFVDVNTRTETR